MANALLTGVSGLSSHQKLLEVIGNNLANLNTTAYKTRRVVFSDLFYETIQGPSGGRPGVIGGTNPIQVGSGSRVSQIDLIRTQGNLVSTGAPLDLAMDGEGYFSVHTGAEVLFTRAGAFKVDDTGILVDASTGYRVQRFGTVGDAGGDGGGFQIAGDNDIRIPLGATVPGRATSNVTLQGNLPSDAKGPAVEVLRNQAAWTTGGIPATSATLLNALDLTSVAYVPGDTIQIAGTDVDGSPVSSSLAVDGTTTLGQLVAAINAAYPGATASLDANARITLTADEPGEAYLSLTLTNGIGNTGSAALASNAVIVETNGQIGDTYRGVVEVFDPRGEGRAVGLEFEKQADGTWTLNTSLDPSQGTIVNGTIQNIRFND
ncbi:MAG: flagellar hook-basal body complex protein, partial [Planctomycetaceae bacterium]|nr:flagellar hook-basal body complex protein [Planctomycetaceae bacterium]